MFTICLAMAKSSSSFFSSKMTKNRSNLDIMGGEISTFHLKDLVLSYLPLNGAWMPALAIEIVYCSIAS
jgi:hypothetical protein